MSTKQHHDPTRATHRRLSLCSFAWTFLVIGLLLLPSGTATARGRSRSAASRAQAIARAQRTRLVAEIRREIAAAQQVLQRVQSQHLLTQQQLQRDAELLLSARQTLDDSKQRDTQMHRTLREVEARILDRQGPESDYQRKSKEVEDTRLALDKELHRVLHLPEELHTATDIESKRLEERASASREQLRRLDADVTYQAALARLIKACRELSNIEQALYRADSAWQQAASAHRSAESNVKDGAKNVGLHGRSAQADKQVLQNTQQIAAEARSVIVRGEAQLRQLGVGVR